MTTTPTPTPTNGSSTPTTLTTTTNFEVYVSKESFKFNAAHFVAYRGFRERLHGHNYRCSVRLYGSRYSGGRIGHDGYVIDFGDVKDVVKRACKELNEHFLCPMYSDVLEIEHDEVGKQILVKCQVDGTQFVFPRDDCALLPLVHTSAEEIAVYLWGEILRGLDGAYLAGRGIQTMEVTVAEAPGQEATFRHDIRTAATTTATEASDNGDGDNHQALDVRQFISDFGTTVPKPCLTNAATTTNAGNGGGGGGDNGDGEDEPDPKRRRRISSKGAGCCSCPCHRKA